ncbi:translocation/assembly module TamB domain-containing protein [Synechocystis sp. LEGE 06083]|uniref:translocation/assembly module TamB domain-containing protein n=1 Tax=Synechocystis sp. LEGE 06083 TaxID=915336 RepID=UPI001881C518|nr:translocation/assembly module TamB domain-containing protein [Synechocystis sp. LEGE 06083]MBE9195333.1 translocation/assembly module TamB domain-containing protein [Synechocystis sp. LEGE 06083]
MSNNPSPHSAGAIAKLRRWLTRPSTLITLGGLAVAGTGLYLGGQHLAYREASPFLESELSRLLGRPVDIGPVEDFRLLGVRLGNSSLPRTADDATAIAIEAIEVDVNPLPFLVGRPVEVSATIVNPQVTLEQQPTGQWTTITLPEGDKPFSLPLDLTVGVTLENAQLQLLPQGFQQAVEIIAAGQGGYQYRRQDDGPQQTVSYDLGVQLAGSDLQAQGQTVLNTGESQTDVTINRLDLPALASLLPPLPVTVEKGQVSGQVQGTLPSWQQWSALQTVGDVKLAQLQARIDKVKAPLQVGLDLGLTGQKLQINQGTINLGPLNAMLQGTIDWRSGYDVQFSTKAIDTAAFLDTIAVPLPLPITGEVQVRGQLQGHLTEPQLQGQLTNVATVTLDRVPLNRLGINFRADLDQVTLADVSLRPVSGGEIQARVQSPWKLRQLLTPEANQWRWQAIPVTGQISGAIATMAVLETYDLNLRQVEIGNLGFSGQAGGTLGNPRLNVQWQTTDGDRQGRLNLGTRGEANLVGPQLTLTQAEVSTNQGSLTVQGQANFAQDRWQARWNTAQFPLQPLLQSLCGLEKSNFCSPQLTAQPLTLTRGQGNVSGEIFAFDPNVWQGNAEIQLASQQQTAAISANLTRGQVQADVEARNIAVNQYVPALAAPVDLSLVSAQSQFPLAPLLAGQLPLGQIQARSQFTALVDDRQITGNAQLRAGTVQTNATLGAIALNPFLPGLPVAARLNTGKIQGSAFVGDINTWAGVRNFDLNRLQGEGQLKLTVANGPVSVNGTLLNGNLGAIANVGAIPLNALAPEIPVPAQVQRGRISLGANLADLVQAQPDLSQVAAIANVDLEVAGGTVTSVSALKNLTWQSRLTAREINLNPLLAKYGGTDRSALAPVEGEVRLAGNLANLFSTANNAGTIPVTVQRAAFRSGPQNLNADGKITIGNFRQRPALTNVNLNVSNGLSFAPLPIDALLTLLPLAPEFRPQALAMEGTSQFTGQLTGRNVTGLADLKLAGNLELNNLAVNGFGFEPQLRGPLSVQLNQNVLVDLRGQVDRLAVNFKPCRGNCLFPYLPTSFNLRQAYGREQPILAQGKLNGDRLAMEVKDFPLAILDLRPGVRYQIAGQLDGNLNADLVVNLRNGNGQGNLAIDAVSLGSSAIGEVTAALGYQNQTLQLKQGQVKTPIGQYQAQGSLNFRTEAIQANVNVNGGEIAPLLAAANISDVGSLLRLTGLESVPKESADIVGPLSLGNPDGSLENQLNLLYVIDQRIIALAQQYERGGVPTQLNVQGNFDAALNLNGTLRDPALALKVQGRNWSWYPQGPFPNIVPPIGLVMNETRFLPIEQFQLEAKFADGRLALLPSFVQIRESRLGAEGIFSLEKTQLQWSIKDFNLNNLDSFVEMSSAFGARLNAEGSVALTAAGPALSGKFNFDQITLNARPVPEEVGGQFDYQNNLLQLVTSEASPLYLRADVPFYWNPQEAKAAEGPSTFRAEFKIPPNSLELLDVVSQEQLVWLGGEGQADLKVEGEIDQHNGIGISDLRALGKVSLNGAQIRSAALPTPVQVDGEILFNNTTIAIEQLTGQLDQSRIEVAGVLPLFDAQPGLENPLQVSIKPTNIAIPNLYQGNLAGLVTVEGSALAPKLTGDVALANGRVFVPDRSLDSQPSRIAELRTRLGWFKGTRRSPLVEPQLNDLRITLDNLHIEQEPLYVFTFGGGLTVNGPLTDFNDLRADGTISLDRGRVSFFDTRFLLDRRAPNTITFYSDEDLINPSLNIAMRTIVSDLPQSARMRSQETNEYPDDSLNQIERIDVRLTIDGSLSQILPNINPRYSAVCDPTVTFRPLTGVGSFDEFQLDRLSRCLQILAAQGVENEQIFSNPALNLTSSPPRTEGEIVRLLGEQVIVLVDALQGKNSSQLLQVGITQLAIPMIFQGLVYDVETAISDKIKSTDFRVVPFLEAIYEVEDKGYMRFTYDYNFSQFIIRYEKQF